MDEPLPMFPLGSVLLPGMPVALTVFEPRYLAMLAELTAAPVAEFGVVLIERGRETGGGDARFGTATVARVVEVQPRDGAVGIVAIGGRRVDVRSWLPDDPYPRAVVDDRSDLPWEESAGPLLDATVAVVEDARRRLGAGEAPLSLPEDDHVSACWRLGGLAPVGPLDRLAMLRSASVTELLERIATTTREVLVLHESFGELDGPGSGPEGGTTG